MHPKDETSQNDACPVDQDQNPSAGQPSSDQPSWQGHIGRFSHWPGSDRLTRILSFGFARTMLRRGAKRGDLISRLEVDPALREDPFPAYDTLRGRGPIVRGAMILATADHAAGTEVLRSSSFGVGDGKGELPPWIRRLIDGVKDPQTLGPIDPPSLLSVDPPLHTRYRRLVSHAFNARSVAGNEDRIQNVADRLLDRMEGAGLRNFDLVDQYTALLPVAVISDILGVPEIMHSSLLTWGNGAATSLDPGLSWQQYREVGMSLRNLTGWFNEHIANLRKDPGDDLLSQLIQLDGDDELTDIELRAIGLLVLGAGFETTVNLMGNAVTSLSAHPEQLEILQSEPDRWGNAVDEVLRYDSPVQLTVRQAYSDCVIEGSTVTAGESVIVMLGGANRDPKIFDDPHTFNVSRHNASDHLAFSSGIHYCLGAQLAKREGTIGLRSLYERFPHLTLQGGGHRRPTRVLRGWESLPVTVR